MARKEGYSAGEAQVEVDAGSPKTWEGTAVVGGAPVVQVLE